MKTINRLMSEPLAKSAAKFMKYVSYLMMLLLTLGIVMSFIGRQTFILHTSSDVYPSATYAGENSDWTSNGITVSMNDEIHIHANEEDKIDFISQAGLVAMYATNALPLIVCFWILSRVFSDISLGQIFTERNAYYLLYYGLIQIAATLLGPFLRLLIGYLANLFTGSRLSISTGHDLPSNLITHIAFIVAAYVIHYGVHLQDEVDHTI